MLSRCMSSKFFMLLILQQKAKCCKCYSLPVYCLHKLSFFFFFFEWMACFLQDWKHYLTLLMLASKFKCVLHNILAIFLRHSKLMLLSVLEWVFSLRMRPGKMCLIWRQFGAYWRKIGYSFLHSRELFLLYIHLNKFDITGGLTLAINITQSGHPSKRKTWVNQKLPAQSAW